MRIFRNIIVVDIQDIYTQPKIKFRVMFMLHRK